MKEMLYAENQRKENPEAEERLKEESCIGNHAKEESCIGHHVKEDPRTDNRAKENSSLRDWFNSKEFREQYHYDGPLGVFCSEEKTEFRLWAPTADQVMLSLYPDGSVFGAEDIVRLQRGEKGVWSCVLPGSWDGYYYDYQVRVDGVIRRTADPYAKACGINGKRSMILNLRRTDPAGWEDDQAPEHPAENIIYEIHVGDFSASEHSGIAPRYRGKFRALCEEGTTLDNDGIHPTGLDYLKRLGITHVQLMPVFDYGSVDEKHPDENFNWGYDPLNYNVPEGAYSTDPWHGEVRIREMKEAIQSLHRNGFRVIMDVVYNHTYSLDSWLWRTVPWYYYRQEEDGTPSNGSGCSNDLASERSMCARYILESVLYWTEEYHIDGFRFDLMGLLDVPLMNRIREALDERYGKGEKILFGEPWSAASTAAQPGTELGTKEHLKDLNPEIGAFCDATRDAIKGSVMDAESVGMVNGGVMDAKVLKECFLGWTNSGKEFSVQSPSQTISYLSCHDDWTLWDKLVYSMDPEHRFEASTPEIMAANRLAATIAFACHGNLFFLSGEEFGRTKKGIKNSYDSPISVNRLDWQRAWENESLVEYYRGLIALRKMIPALTVKEAAENVMDLKVVQHGKHCCVALLKDRSREPRWEELVLVINCGRRTLKIKLPDASWQPLYNGTDIFLWEKNLPDVEGTVKVGPMSAASWGKRRVN